MNDFKNAPEDFLLIQETETQTLPFRKWFFVRKEKAVKKKTRHEKHTQMGFELLTSRVTIQHVTTCAFTVFLTKKISCRF